MIYFIQKRKNLVKTQAGKVILFHISAKAVPESYSWLGSWSSMYLLAGKRDLLDLILLRSVYFLSHESSLVTIELFTNVSLLFGIEMNLLRKIGREHSCLISCVNIV